ncbi:MAG: hypothetical protein ACLQBB_02030 [Solirubrobacteraceae bacterium]
MNDASYAKAPTWRRTGAGLIDMAFFGALWWFARSRGLLRERGVAAQLMALPGELLREQLRSPGQRVLGTLTVDRRTGRRLALWRTLALVAARAAAAEITRRLEPAHSPELEREREAAGAELGEIMRRHPQASPEREAELQAAYARHRTSMPSLPRTVAPSLLTGIVTTRLRRRLAPTVEILARGRG